MNLLVKIVGRPTTPEGIVDTQTCSQLSFTGTTNVRTILFSPLNEICTIQSSSVSGVNDN